VILRLLYIFLLLVAVAGFSLFYWVFRLGVPPMPSSRGMRETILEEIGRYKKQRGVVDLGSGWGGLAARIARAFPQREVTGMELAPVPYLYSRLLHSRKLGNLTFRREDLSRLEPRDETIYVAYLSPMAMETVRRRFERALPRNAVLISALFSVRPWTAGRTVRARDLHRTNVYVYEIRGGPPL
jgi:hypothetical protein